MKTQLVRRLSNNYLLPNLPCYKSKGHLIYNGEVSHLLQGFRFESSAFDKDLFTIQVFVQPLFIPVTYLTFGYGNRLGFLSKGKDIWWKYEKSNEEAVVLQF